jgi:hypothetical protein
MDFDEVRMISANSNPISYQPRPMTAPKAPLSERINIRVVAFILVMAFIIGPVIYMWFSAVINGGITNHGNYYTVDLKAMSSFDMDQMNATAEDIPKRFRDLEGKQVELIGEMWAPNYAGDGAMRYFQLVYSRTKCCFNGPPLAQHFVDSNVVSGRNAQFSNDQVKVFGTLHIKIRRDPDSGVIKSIYEVDVDDLKPS